MRHRIPFFVLASMTLALLSACGGGRLSTQSASQKLKPVEALPEREQRQVPVNLSVQIENVADSRSSYKNYVRLYINGREIAPEGAEHNLKSDYRYDLRLQPGIYDVEADYHVVGFWRERVYRIKVDEPVKVLPDQQTVLSTRLDKDGRGFPVEENSLFRVEFRPMDRPVAATFSPRAPTPAPAAEAPAPPPVQVIDRTPAPGPVVAVDPQPVPKATPVLRMTKLQINTLPVGADVYVDDKFVGQSPVRVFVPAGEGHVLQIAKAGFTEHLKVLNANELTGRADMQIIVRLEPAR